MTAVWSAAVFRARGSGRGEGGWAPGVAGERGADSGHDACAVLADGVDVAADVQAVLGDVVAGQPPGDLLLGLGRAQVPLADVVGGPDPGVEAEPQDVALPVPAEFQQVAPGWLGGAVTWPGGGSDLGQADPDCGRSGNSPGAAVR